jgi:hypothetical protein
VPELFIVDVSIDRAATIELVVVERVESNRPYAVRQSNEIAAEHSPWAMHSYWKAMLTGMATAFVFLVSVIEMLSEWAVETSEMKPPGRITKL